MKQCSTIAAYPYRADGHRRRRTPIIYPTHHYPYRADAMRRCQQQAGESVQITLSDIGNPIAMRDHWRPGCHPSGRLSNQKSMHVRKIAKLNIRRYERIFCSSTMPCNSSRVMYTRDCYSQVYKTLGSNKFPRVNYTWNCFPRCAEHLTIAIIHEYLTREHCALVIVQGLFTPG